MFHELVLLDKEEVSMRELINLILDLILALIFSPLPLAFMLDPIKKESNQLPLVYISLIRHLFIFSGILLKE